MELFSQRCKAKRLVGSKEFPAYEFAGEVVRNLVAPLIRLVSMAECGEAKPIVAVRSHGKGHIP